MLVWELWNFCQYFTRILDAEIQIKKTKQNWENSANQIVEFKCDMTLNLCILFIEGTGIGMSHRVVGKCVRFCTTSPLHHLTKKVISSSSGMMTTATPRTILSANTRKVSQWITDTELLYLATRCWEFGTFGFLNPQNWNLIFQKSSLKCDHCCQQPALNK